MAQLGHRWLFVAVAAVGAVGCAAHRAVPALPPPDAPVPASEPRAELALEVDLPPAADCEERFDLELYRNRGVELVVWDDASGSCRARAVQIRYLSRVLTREQVLEEVRRLAARATVREGK